MTRERIRALGPADAAIYQALRLQALLETPEAFGSTHAEEVDRDLAEVARRLIPAAPPRASIMIGAWMETSDGEALIGMAGCKQEPHTKTAHKADLVGMYVSPEFRGRGISRRLVEAIFAVAHGWDGVDRINLCVASNNTVARSFYESMGFERWGHEPDGDRVAGISIPLDYMTRTLPSRQGGGE